MTDIEKAAARLKVEMEKEENEDRQAGLEVGRRWATNSASPRELRRLAAAADEPGPDGLVIGLEAGRIPSMLYEVLTKDSGSAWARDFWLDILGEEDLDRIEEEDFAAGFVEGALEVWEAVQEKL